MAASKIEWLNGGHVWNPIVGCAKIAAGCKHCYAETMAKRLAAMAKADIANGRDPGKKEHYQYVVNQKGQWNGGVRFIPESLDEPLRRRKPTTYFVNSMSDLFHEDVPDEFIERVFLVMRCCPQHRFIVLTKRASRMREYATTRESSGGVVFLAAGLAPVGVTNEIAELWRQPVRWPLPNVILGYSASTQKDLDARIGDLLATPAACRMLSLEPLIEGMTLAPWLHTGVCCANNCEWRGFSDEEVSEGGYTSPPDDDDHEAGLVCPDCGCQTVDTMPEYNGQPGIGWVIIGAESGPKRRACELEGVHGIVKQCAAAGVPCFVKQLAPEELYMPRKGRSKVSHDPAEWPEDLRNVRQYPAMLER